MAGHFPFGSTHSDHNFIHKSIKHPLRPTSLYVPVVFWTLHYCIKRSTPWRDARATTPLYSGSWLTHSESSHHPKDLIPFPSLSSPKSENHRLPLCPPVNHTCEFCPLTLLSICYRSWPLPTPQCLTLSRLLLIALSFSSLTTQSSWVHRALRVALRFSSLCVFESLPGAS